MPGELAIMAVEGKVDESFGPLVSEWLREAAPASKKPARLKRLAQTLGIDVSGCETLRYQLLHRTASALYEAHRYNAEVAVMMVHSFDPSDPGFEDFARFSVAMGMAEAAATRLIGPTNREGVDLYLGWAADRPLNEGYSVVDGRKTDVGVFGDDEVLSRQ
jgi:sugar phosphate isomerase/epimerase